MFRVTGLLMRLTLSDFGRLIIHFGVLHQTLYLQLQLAPLDRLQIAEAVESRLARLDHLGGRPAERRQTLGPPLGQFEEQIGRISVRQCLVDVNQSAGEIGQMDQSGRSIGKRQGQLFRRRRLCSQ